MHVLGKDSSAIGLPGQAFAHSGATSSVATVATTYHELSGQVQEVDVLSQLNANLAHLEDLHGRMKFMMTELKGLVKRS